VSVAVRGAERVALVIACWNDGATLGETLDSLADQEPLQIVVVDDGSSDPHTIEVLARVERAGTTVLRQANAGPAAARMAGVAATSAPYVFALDADDLAAPGALAQLADVLDADPDCALAWGDELVFGDVEVYVRSVETLDPWRITYQNGIPMSSLVRRERLLAVGGWGFRDGYEDWDLWMSFAEQGWEGRRIPTIAGFHRQHGNRRFASDRARHEQLVARLEERHSELFSARRTNRWRSSAPRRLRTLLPLVWRLPLSGLAKRRIANFLSDPVKTLNVLLSRFRDRSHQSRAPEAHRLPGCGARADGD
jgi:glycosyltransferase involved in cell wall biosynthesis